MNEVWRDLDELVNNGLVKKARSKGRVVYYVAFVERAERLIKKGVEPHEAYWTAIYERAPNLDPRDIAELTATYICNRRNPE